MKGCAYLQRKLGTIQGHQREEIIRRRDGEGLIDDRSAARRRRAACAWARPSEEVGPAGERADVSSVFSTLQSIELLRTICRGDCKAEGLDHRRANRIPREPECMRSKRSWRRGKRSGRRMGKTLW